MSASQWVGGQRVSSERLANMLHKSFDFSPDWGTTTGVGSPSYGNAVIDCRFSQSGDLVVAHYDITFGSTTNFGGGGTGDNYQWSLPVASAEARFDVGEIVIGTNAAGAKLTCRARILGTTQLILEISNNRVDSGAIANQGVADATSPFVWASGTSLKGVIEYEAA